jgi:hypothetical protein
MQQQKKSRKFSVLAAILILLAGVFIGGYLVLKSGRGFAGQLTEILGGQTTAVATCTPDPYDSGKDSDDDGLKDWQEMQIYKSDPCKADTDGDGYLDGEEVASGYDPTKKAPGDELPGVQTKSRGLPKNLTQALRQKLAAQIEQNKIVPFAASGELLSAEEIENYPGIQQSIQETINNAGSLFAPDKITDEQIKTTPDNSKEAVQRFAAQVATTIPSSVGSDLLAQSEAEMFLSALEKNDFTSLEKELQIYQGAYEKLKGLTVPSNLAPLHKEQLEILSQTIKIYQAIKEINIDPLKANLALQAYELLGQRVLNWTQKLSQFIQNNYK